MQSHPSLKAGTEQNYGVATLVPRYNQLHKRPGCKQYSLHHHPTTAWGQGAQTETPAATQGSTGRGLPRGLGRTARHADRGTGRHALNSRAPFIEPEKDSALAARGSSPCPGPHLGSPPGCPQIPSPAPYIHTHPPTPGGVGDGQGCLGNEPRIGLVRIGRDGGLKIAPG